MPELRRDPTTGDWIVMAPERSLRPRDAAVGAVSLETDPSADCPFCPGHEDRTPPEIDRETRGDGAAWAVRVVPNRYPAFIPSARPLDDRGDGLLIRRPAIGAHEVVIETPDHGLAFADLDAEQARRVVAVYQRRFRALASQPDVRSITIFRNQGPEAGASLEHPHSQIIASSIENQTLRRQQEQACRFAVERDGCLFCRLVDLERADGRRVVFEEGDLVAVTPYASRVSFEIWIVPATHEVSFAEASPELVTAVARALRRALSRLRDAASDPPYNFMLISSLPGEASEGVHWHWRIVPHVDVPAGFELATGGAINPLTPEDAARRLRVPT